MSNKISLFMPFQTVLWDEGGYLSECFYKNDGYNRKNTFIQWLLAKYKHANIKINKTYTTYQIHTTILWYSNRFLKIHY